MKKTPEQIEFERRVRAYRATLNRIPAEQFLGVFADDFDEGVGACCVCGRALRESMARTLNHDVPADSMGCSTDANTLAIRLTESHGGTPNEWILLYWGACGSSGPAVETAVVDRLNALVRS